MLVLTRNISEAIFIGDDIKVMVLSIKGGQIRLGIKAPKKIPVHREEIFLRMQQEKKSNSSK